MTLSARIVASLAMAGLLVACSGHKRTPVTTVLSPAKKLTVAPQVPAKPYSYLFPPRKFPGEQWTVNEVVQTYGTYVEQKLNYYFTAANISYPPREIVLVALKQEKKLELWAREDGNFRFIRDFFILAASGVAGPKLQEGDRQVPEGIYRIVEMNPNSHFHLSMKLDYPNEFDRYHAQRERRTNLGGDIFIHGKSASIGCLAMGDESIEELFVLAAKVGVANVKIVISPHDPRVYPLGTHSEHLPSWIPELYANITREIVALSSPVKSARTGF